MPGLTELWGGWIERLLRTRWRPASRTARAGERAAWNELRRRGYGLIGRNVCLRSGEVDILCTAPDGRTVVIVEVKASAVGSSGPPPETRVGADKTRTLLAIAGELGRRPALQNRRFRIDIVGVDLAGSGRPAVRVFEDAVRAN